MATYRGQRRLDTGALSPIINYQFSIVVSGNPFPETGGVSSAEDFNLRTRLVCIGVIAIVVGGLIGAAHRLKPKAPPPTSAQIWADSGVPVRTSTIIRGDMDQSVEVTGDINALNEVTLSSKIPGRIAAVYAREGDKVSTDEVIVVLDQDDAQSNLASAQGGLESAIAKLSQARTNATVTKIQTDSAIDQAQSSLDAANARLEVVRKPSRTQERMVAENRVASAQADLENAEANFKRMESLLKEGAIAQSSYDVAKAQHSVALEDYKSAKDQLSLIKEGGRVEDISAAQAQAAVAKEQLRAAKANASENLLRAEDVKSALAGVRQARAAVALARQQLANTYIKSPISGEMASRTAEPGQVVTPGQALAQVVNLSSVYFKGDVSEKGLNCVAKGQVVPIEINALPGKEFRGVVTEIYPSGSNLSRNFPVRITLGQPTRGIKPGMFARGRIITGISRDVLLIPKDALDERKGTQSVYTLTPRKTVKRHIVSVIRENRDYVQIDLPTDLKPGDTVITEGRREFARRDEGSN